NCWQHDSIHSAHKDLRRKSSSTGVFCVAAFGRSGGMSFDVTLIFHKSLRRMALCETETVAYIRVANVITASSYGFVRQRPLQVCNAGGRSPPSRRPARGTRARANRTGVRHQDTFDG